MAASYLGLVNWSSFDYKQLKNIPTIRLKVKAANGYNLSLNNVIAMADTETSKTRKNDIELVNKKWFNYETDEFVEYKAPKFAPVRNYVVKWSFALRFNGENYVTLWGNKPSEFAECLGLVCNNMKGSHTIIYFHNLAYDWAFLRQYLIARFGNPDEQLNTDSRNPIRIKFGSGLEIRDSLILANCSLDMWAKNMDVPHKKAKGKWDYNVIRNASFKCSDDENEYIENDVLAGVECIDTYMQTLGYDLSTIPLTSTGHSRKQMTLLAKKNNERSLRLFKNTLLTFEQFQIIEKIYHGGFTHGNRDYLDRTLKGLIQCFDFASSYPYIMLALAEFEVGPYTKVNMSLDDILDEDIINEYAFIMKLKIKNLEIKDDEPKPTISSSKCEYLSPHYTIDNGRLLSADEIEIWTNEIDLQVYLDTYIRDDSHIWEIKEVQSAPKGYLPKYIRDMVFELFTNKTKLKGQGAIYALAKAVLNALYGMCCQNPVKLNIEEDYEEFIYKKTLSKVSNDVIIKMTGKNREEVDEETLEAYDELFTKVGKFNDWVENNIAGKSTRLPYQWGARISSCAFKNLIELSKCVADGSIWIYSDTDSIYAWNRYGKNPWDMDRLNSYNQKCKDAIIESGYGPVIHNGREYWLGVAESEGEKDQYTEFRTLGAKRYVGRNVGDGELHLTLAGVPKSGVVCLNNDIDNFTEGFVFPGNITGKKLHTYEHEKIGTDENGNEFGDWIDLTEADYLLSASHIFEEDEIGKHYVIRQIIE